MRISILSSYNLADIVSSCLSTFHQNIFIDFFILFRIDIGGLDEAGSCAPQYAIVFCGDGAH